MVAEALALASVPAERVQYFPSMQAIRFAELLFYTYPSDCKAKAALSSFQRPIAFAQATFNALATPAASNSAGAGLALAWVSAAMVLSTFWFWVVVRRVRSPKNVVGALTFGEQRWKWAAIGLCQSKALFRRCCWFYVN